MKLLVLLLAVLFGVWLWQRGRKPTQPTHHAQPNPPPDLRPMAQCLHCQIHFPQEESVKGRLGFYCSEVHRLAAGDSSPPL